MTRTAVTLGGLAGLLLAGGVLLWRMTGDIVAAPVAATAAAAPAAAGRPGAPSASRQAHASPGRLEEDPRSDDPPELAMIPIKRAFIQRDDDAVPRAKDATPPLFSRTTLAAVRTAATPAVEQCMEASFKTYPENRGLDTKPSVSIIFTAVAAGGVISITRTDSVMNGTQEDDLRRCIETAYKQLSVRASPGQPDGEGRIQSTFDYK